MKQPLTHKTKHTLAHNTRCALDKSYGVNFAELYKKNIITADRDRESRPENSLSCEELPCQNVTGDTCRRCYHDRFNIKKNLILFG